MAFAELEPTRHYEYEQAADGRLFSVSDIPEASHLALVPDLPEPHSLSDAYMLATEDLLGYTKAYETDASKLDPYYAKPARHKDIWNGLGQIGVTAHGEYIETEDTEPGTHVATLYFNPVRSAWLIATTRQQGTRDEAVVYQDGTGDLHGNFVTYDAAGRATSVAELAKEDATSYETFLVEALRPETIGRQIQAARTARDMVRHGIEDFFARADMEMDSDWLGVSEADIKRAASVVASAKTAELAGDRLRLGDDNRKVVDTIYRSGEGLAELRKEVTSFPLTHMTAANTPPLVRE